jgi:hypothetical protein
MSTSPWSAYGRTPPKSAEQPGADKQNPIAGVLNDIVRGREEIENFVGRLLREYHEIRSGNAGYRRIIADALTPSNRPETIEERLTRFAAQAQTRRSSRPPGTRSR